MVTNPAARRSADTAVGIELRDVSFAWPGSKPLLCIPQLRIYSGERVLLRGASGSGKSTLLGIITGVLEPQRGEVQLMGTRLGGMKAGLRDRFRGERIGFIFQMFNLVPYLDVVGNVLLPLQFSPRRRERLSSDPQTEALRLLAALGLSGSQTLRRPVMQLSIGQQQRVAAARALIGRPDILIADEPTSALDSDARADFMRLLLHECQTAGATLLFVSHDASLEPFFQRTLTMKDVNTTLQAA